MPNHVTTIIEAPKLVLDSLATDETPVEFSNLIPFPADLEGITAEVRVFATQEEADAYQAEMEERFSKLPAIFGGGEKQTHALTQQRADELFAKYGALHWYSWHTTNWGTKWGAYDVTRVSDTRVRFDTAWSHPVPVVKALSKKFGTQALSVAYADEDTGYNLGLYRILNGEVVEEYEFTQGDAEATEFASQVRYGMSYADHMREYYTPEELEEEGISITEATNVPSLSAFASTQTMEVEK